MPQWPNSIQKELSIDQQQSKTWLSWQQYMGFANMTGNWLSTDKLQHILQEINDLKGCLQKTNELLHHYQQTLELYAYPFVEEDFQQVITKA